MPRRTMLIGCLALALFVRTVHCLHLDATLYANAIAARTSAPLADPNGSDPNETGCICKGAVFAVPCMPADLEAQGARLMLADPTLVPVILASLSPAEPAPAHFIVPPPRSARIVRALFACWQILSRPPVPTRLT